MRVLVTDQEGALSTDMIGKCCEKFNIDHDFGGSQGHTSAPLAERPIEILRLGAQKLWRTVQKTGRAPTQEDRVSETAMSSNLMLTYGGFTRRTALLGYTPTELHDPENAGIASASGVLETPRTRWRWPCVSISTPRTPFFGALLKIALHVPITPGSRSINQRIGRSCRTVLR